MPRVIERAPWCAGRKWMWLAIMLCLFDQISKTWIVNTISFNAIKPIMPGLQFTLSTNRGIAFSFLSNQPQWGTYLLTFGVLIFTIIIGRWLIRTPANQPWEGYALALIFGGAVGNLIDRIWHGYVIDFIDLYYGSFHWYTFNLADLFISLGAILLIRTIFCQGEACQTENP